MNARVLIEFVVNVPNDGIARDVHTRLTREHRVRLCEVFASVMGYEPLQAPGKGGMIIVIEGVTWDAAEQDWISSEDEDVTR